MNTLPYSKAHQLNALARNSRRERKNKKHLHRVHSRDCEYLGFRPLRNADHAVNKITK